MAEKTPNYTDEQAAELKAAYQSAEGDEARASVVAEYATEFGKTKRSIVAKLVTMKAYQKAKPTTKAGKAVERKGAIVDDIAAAMGCAPDVVGSLESATKDALQRVRFALTERAASTD